jgi:hypothetical protein
MRAFRAKHVPRTCLDPRAADSAPLHLHAPNHAITAAKRRPPHRSSTARFGNATKSRTWQSRYLKHLNSQGHLEMMIRETITNSVGLDCSFYMVFRVLSFCFWFRACCVVCVLDLFVRDEYSRYIFGKTNDGATHVTYILHGTSHSAICQLKTSHIIGMKLSTIVGSRMRGGRRICGQVTGGITFVLKRV